MCLGVQSGRQPGQQPLIPGVSPLKKPLPVFNEPVWQLSLPCYPINLQLIGPMNVEQRVKTGHLLNAQMHLNSTPAWTSRPERVVAPAPPYWQSGAITAGVAVYESSSSSSNHPNMLGKQAAITLNGIQEQN